MFMENLPKKGPLSREFWAQKPTHMGGTYPYPQHVPGLHFIVQKNRYLDHSGVLYLLTAQYPRSRKHTWVEANPPREFLCFDSHRMIGAADNVSLLGPLM